MLEPVDHVVEYDPLLLPPPALVQNIKQASFNSLKCIILTQCIVGSLYAVYTAAIFGVVERVENYAR